MRIVRGLFPTNNPWDKEKKEMSNLPKWVEELKKGANAGRAYKALSIALKALNQCTLECDDGCSMGKCQSGCTCQIAKEALRRIEELGKE